MKVFALLIIGALVGAAGYLFGTEAGRQQKDALVGKIRKGNDSAADAVSDAIEDAAAAGKDAVDQLAS